MGITFWAILTSIRRNHEIRHLGGRWKFSLYGTLFNITEYSVKGNSSGTSACWVYFFANLIAHQTLTSFQNPLWCSSVGPINIREGGKKKNKKKTRQHQGARGGRRRPWSFWWLHNPPVQQAHSQLSTSHFLDTVYRPFPRFQRDRRRG
jgi:hypothetical protein